MRNARQYNGRVTIGCVPAVEDIEDLKKLAFRTLVDLRAPDEKFNGTVQIKAADVGLSYVAIPVARNGITIDDVISFYRIVHAKNTAPLYVFSRQGRKPLAFLLMFDAVIMGHTVERLHERAAMLGLDLRGDSTLSHFIMKAMEEERLLDEAESLRNARPDIFGPTLR